MAFNIMTKLRLFKQDESGASMVEYGIALLVVTAIGIAAMNIIGRDTGTRVSNACANVAINPADC